MLPRPIHRLPQACALAGILAASAPSAFAQEPPAGAPGAAQPPPPLSEALTGNAKLDYDAGRLLFNDGDFAGALLKFRRAYDESRDPRLLWDQAVCEKNLRHYAKVIKLTQLYLSAGGSSVSSASRAEATELVQALGPMTAHLKLTAKPAGASVYVDDDLVGVTPLTESPLLDLGTHKLRVSEDGYRESTTDLVVSGSGDVVVDVVLERDVHEGTLVVQAGDRDGIAIDGSTVGLGRWQGTLRSGGHSVRVTAPNKRPYQAEVLLQDGAVRTLNVTLDDEPRSGGLPAWAWVVGGTALAGGAAVGGYFLLKPKDVASGPSVVGTMAPGTVQLQFR